MHEGDPFHPCGGMVERNVTSSGWNYNCNVLSQTQQSGCYIGFLGQIIRAACIWWHICGNGISAFHTGDTPLNFYLINTLKVKKHFNCLVSFSIHCSRIRGTTKRGLGAGVCRTAWILSCEVPSSSAPISSVLPEILIRPIKFIQSLNLCTDGTSSFHETRTAGVMWLIATVICNVNALDSMKP